jgi:hypothetical protein
MLERASRLKVTSITILSVLFGSGAAATSYYRPDVLVRDAPEEQRLYLEVRNTTKKPMCFDQGNWPNSEGEIDSAKDRAFIEAEGKRFPMTDFDTGYCPGCVARLPPGKSLTAFVKYSDFELPARYEAAPKRLIFQPAAFSCARR